MSNLRCLNHSTATNANTPGPPGVGTFPIAPKMGIGSNERNTHPTPTDVFGREAFYSRRFCPLMKTQADPRFDPASVYLGNAPDAVVNIGNVRPKPLYERLTVALGESRSHTETNFVGARSTGDRFKNRWIAIHATIASLRLLKDDWDGEYAEAPSEGVIAMASRLAHALETAPGSVPPDAVYATPAGTVVFSWHQDGVVSKQVEAVECGFARWISHDGEGSYRHGIVDFSGSPADMFARTY